MSVDGHDLYGYMEPLPGANVHWRKVSDKNLASKESQMDEQAENMREYIFYQSTFMSP